MYFEKMDLNADLGEGYGHWSMTNDQSMLETVTSANIACGGHASDPDTMFETLSWAKQQNVTIGAHPGFDDKVGFGRRLISMTPKQIGKMVAAQIGALMGVSALAGATVRYVKPHGALANLAATDVEVATEICRATQSISRSTSRSLAILAISGTQLQSVAQNEGVQTFSEIFADRAYDDQGLLVPRSSKGAMITDPDIASARLLKFLRTGKMETHSGAQIALEAHSVCVHADEPNAVLMAQRLKNDMQAASVRISSFL